MLTGMCTKFRTKTQLISPKIIRINLNRKVPPQPNVFTSGGSGSEGGKAAARYNLRRFSELPYHLVGAERTEELFQEVC